MAIIRLTDAEHIAKEEIRVRCRDGELHPASLVSLPMYDLEKKIPRGLEVDIPEFY